MYKYILASASSRRRDLLEQIGLSFEIIESDVDEIINSSIPETVVIDLSSQKARDVYGRLKTKEDAVVIGADTIVYFQGQILGKPKSREDAFSMISSLAGNSHWVYTGVTLVTKEGVFSFAEKTQVSFYPMKEWEIQAYIESKDPFDKAGAYGIQGQFAKFIKKIDGDYNNVVGLPVGRIYQELKRQGLY